MFTSALDYRTGARERMAKAVVAAAERAGAGRLVLKHSGVSAVLRRVREIVLGGRTPAVILQPTVYMDNLRAPWALPGIVRDGVFAYPIPPDLRVSWISHQTLGEYAATADGVTGRVFNIGGPTALTGVEVAALLSARAGRPVRFLTIPLNEFAAGLNAAFGPPAGDDIADLYRFAAEHQDALVSESAAAAVR